MILPMALQNLLSSLVSASDAIMLGVLNQDSLSAVSLASRVTFMAHIVLIGVIGGMAALAAQYWGKKDEKTVEQVLGMSLRYTLLFMGLLFLGAVFCPWIFMHFLTNDPVLIDLGNRYLRIVGVSYLFMGISQVYLTMMKNTDRVSRSSVYGSVAVVLNIILNAFLIYGLFGLPQLGIEGAAIATTISRGVELILVLIENRKKDVVRIIPAKILHTPKLLEQDFWKITLPVLGNLVTWGFAMTVYSSIIGHMGNDAVAAHSISNIVKDCVDCVGGGCATGAAILLGNTLGRGDLAQAKKDGARFVRTSFWVGACAGLVILAITPAILHFSTNLSEGAHQLLKYMLFICSYYMIGRSLNTTIINGVFQAGGDTKFSFWCDLVNLYVIILPIGLLGAFVFHWPVMLVYFILYLDEFTKLPIEYVHYKKYIWVKDLTREQME